ncbi:MAG: ABC transporter permease [Candidatus Cloacimonadota bacterium]|nr:ABC transporter permease [Candidatus Cloacimonadota bacterium]
MKILALIKKDIKQFFKSRSAVVLTYFVPMVLSLIFGLVFGGLGSSGGISEIKILLVDDDKTEFSEQFRTVLDSLPELAIHTKYVIGDSTCLFTLDKMDDWIIRGKRGLGVYIPAGFQQKMDGGERLPLEIHYDPKCQIEYGIVSGMIQKTIMSKFPKILMNSMWKKSEDFLGIEKNDKFKSEISFAVSKYFPDANLDDKPIETSAVKSISSENSQNADSNFMENPLEITKVELLGQKEKNPMYAQYIAGMAVMFLLFSVTQAGASILEEKNDGTIKRLLIAPVSKQQILTAKMLFSTLMGISQLLVLFIFGWLVFGLNIFQDIPALLTMIVVTALACSSIGIFIAAICGNLRTVNSLSTLLILTMSLLGGSMVPIFFMPGYIRLISKFTLNSWAMHGFTNIFWRNLHLGDILPDVGVLFGIFLVFYFLAVKIFEKKLAE